jgi:excisionase family DNA binding protein
MAEMKIALTILQAAERIGVGRTTIYKLISTRRLTPRKLGKRTLIVAEELDALVKSLPAGGPTREK